ncbi:uncharacterized protein LOC130591812 [Beta vulgaris subsp. vulgaris]|uniref:uncharacterized protein LOC130591812 n=1 Tax=Beta vulgaris subsp. vulgaris TaxID=3555 RepID=UPI002548CE5F|nr:uncharacterized protein LOC130591812 [Beta vulgaris subsp. vulgaris]
MAEEMSSDSDSDDEEEDAGSTEPPPPEQPAAEQPATELLQVQNLNGDLPIHVAAKSCQLDAVKKLVLGDISMLERENHDDYKNTALHIALENQQEEMAKFLFRKCPKTFYQLNKQGISPLYLAIKAEFWELVRDIRHAF